MAKTSRQMSEIDRLIELASDEKPQPAVIERTLSHPDPPPNLSLSREDKKDPRSSMWRILLQLRVLLPYLSRVLPLLERGLLGTNLTGSAAAADTSHFDRGFAGIEGGHRKLAQQIDAQTTEIKYLQEQVAVLGEAIEKEQIQRAEIAATLSSLGKTIQTWGIILTVLLIALLGLVIFLVSSRPG